MKIIPCIKSANKAAVLLITLASLCLCSGCGRKKIDTGQWYDYGNGMINLSKVSYIDFHPEEILNGGDIDEYVEQQMSDIDSYKPEFQGMYKGVQAHIKFDDFTLKLCNYRGRDAGEAADLLEEALNSYSHLVDLLNAIRY